MKKYLIGSLLLAVSSISFAQITADGEFVVDKNKSFAEQSVYPSYLYSGFPSVEISRCIPNTTNCINIKLNSKALEQLLSGDKLTNKMESNMNLNAHATLNDEYFGIYRNLGSILVMLKNDHNPEQKSITFKYNLVLQNGDTQHWFNQKGIKFTVSDNDYDELMKLVAKKNSSSKISSTQPQIIKKSKSGVCHDKFSSFYNRTKNYTAYDSIQECLDSGGRLPKK